MSLDRMNLISKEYTGNQTFNANTQRGYLLIQMGNSGGTVELGEGGGQLSVPAGGVYEPLICPISQIDVRTTGSFVVITGG